MNPDLPTLAERLPGLFRRARGAAFVLCAAPSRRALAGVREAALRLAREAGRPAFDPARPLPGAVHVETVGAPTWTARRVAILDLNRRRDAFADRGAVVVVGLLACDLPRFAAVAPDLWTTRTAMVRHDAAPAPPPVAPEALPLPESGPTPGHLDALARALPLQVLRLEARGGGGLRTLSMDDLYVDPLAAGPAPPRRPPGFRPTEGPALPLLTRYPLAVLEGETGSGKTTLLRRYARARARRGDPVLLVEAAALPPGSLSVSDLEAAARSLAAAGAGEPATPPRPPAVGAAGPPPLVLLDGLEELPDPAARREALLALGDLHLVGRAAGVLVAVRAGALPGDGQPPPPAAGDLPPARSLPDGFARVRLLGFRAAQIRAYVHRWAERSGGGDRERDRLLRMLGLHRLEEPPEAARRLGELARRPLFLAVLCGRAWARGHEPEGETDLLDALVDVLVADQEGSPLRRHDLRWMAGRLAWALHERGRSHLPLAEAAPAAGLAPEDVEAVRHRTALLDGRGEAVGFCHQALRDVLVADQALDLLDWNDPEAVFRFVWAGRPFLDDVVLSAPGRLLLERAGRVLPRHLLAALEALPADSRYLPETLARAFLQAETLVAAWRGLPPYALAGLRRRAVAALEAFNRDPDAALRPDTPTFPRTLLLHRSARLLQALSPRRHGALCWQDVGGGWALARWPVTVREYRRFLDAGGYDDPDLWTPEGRRWRKRPRKGRPADRPEGWGGPHTRDANPVTGLSRHEAEAYVAWVRRRSGDPRICLPDAATWCRAARRGPYWAHPAPPHPPSFGLPPVGANAAGATADGVEDLGTLVRERLGAGAAEAWAGHAWCEEPRPLAGTVTVLPRGRRAGPRAHLFGLRLARRP